MEHMDMAIGHMCGALFRIHVVCCVCMFCTALHIEPLYVILALTKWFSRYSYSRRLYVYILSIFYNVQVQLKLFTCVYFARSN